MKPLSWTKSQSNWKRSNDSNLYILPLILPLLLISLWYTAGIHQDRFFPGPDEVGIVFWDYIFGNFKLSAYSGTFLMHLSHSLRRVGIGFFLASLLGIGFALLSRIYRKFYAIFDPMTHMIKAVPGIAWLPLALFILGVGETTTLFLIALAAFFPIYINTLNGLKMVDTCYIETALLMGISNIQLLVHVLIPLSFSSIITGLRLGLGTCWGYLVLGELTGVSKGMGAVMMDARMFGNIEIILVSMISLAVLGITSDRILLLAMTPLKKWYE